MFSFSKSICGQNKVIAMITHEMYAAFKDNHFFLSSYLIPAQSEVCFVRHQVGDYFLAKLFFYTVVHHFYFQYPF